MKQETVTRKNSKSKKKKKKWCVPGEDGDSDDMDGGSECDRIDGVTRCNC